MFMRHTVGHPIRSHKPICPKLGVKWMLLADTADYVELGRESWLGEPESGNNVRFLGDYACFTPESGHETDSPARVPSAVSPCQV